tara:strand:+ start:3641 stop:3844 length:204 start_codon:yes stop_codon:yes gene_type:complete
MINRRVFRATTTIETLRSKLPGMHSLNTFGMENLDGFQRKNARRVEARDGIAKLSFADNQIGYRPIG